MLCVDDNSKMATVWSYGRYDGASSSGGTLNPVGPGVFRQMEGLQALQFVKAETNVGGTLYEIPNASAEKANSYFQGIYDNSTQSSTRHPSDGKVIDTYTVPTNTCVTKTENGVAKGV